MASRIALAQPDASITGFTIQPMIHRPHATELIVGMVDDRQFGPVLLFGHGGTAVEVIDDKALALPPLNLRLAHELIAGTQVHRLLRGYRGVPAANLEALALTLVKVSQLIIDHPDIVELDINPLLADADGVMALDARIRVESTADEPHERLAIRPYPKNLEDIVLVGNRRFLLRPVRPEDEPALRDAIALPSPADVRMPAFTPSGLDDHASAVRFTQIDYDRQMVLVLTEPGIPGRTTIHGLIRLMESPDREDAEFALFVTAGAMAFGGDALLLRHIVDYARGRGVGEIHGRFSQDDRRLQDICAALGFVATGGSDPGTIGELTLKLA
jgi:acetyltransferase